MAGINIGANAIQGGYLGSTPLVSAYIGNQQIWSSGPYTGITITKEKTFVATGGTDTLKIKSGNDWTLTNDANWITLSALSGTTADTGVTITVDNYTSTAENRTAIITATNETSAVKTCTVTQKKVYTGPANNEIWYTTTGGTVIGNIAASGSSGSLTVVSNVYQNGKGVITYSGDILYLGQVRYASNSNTLMSMDLPASLTQIPDYFIYGEGSNYWTGLTFNSDVFTYIGHESISCENSDDIKFPLDVQEVRGKINFWSLWGGALSGFSCTEASGVTEISYYSYGTYYPWNSNFTYLRLPNINISFKADNITGMTASAWVDLFNDLADVTSLGSRTLTIGSSNLALLTAEQKAIATNKGWTLI